MKKDAAGVFIAVDLPRCVLSPASFLNVPVNHRAPLAFLWSAPVFLVFLGFGAAYFLTRSPSLDEWDSIQFALGVGDFDLWRHQPHPPGYPLYIAAAWGLQRLLALDVTSALELASALGGGLFVACWFRIVSRHFGSRTGWLFAASLGTLLITWMSATKALSDPLGTGFLALALLLADDCRSRRRATMPRLVAMAIAAAAATGVRPQNFGILLLIVCLATAGSPARPARLKWTAGIGAFAFANLLWLLPTVYLQSRTPEARGDWLAYGRQLFGQWVWRLDQPKAFIAATVSANTVAGPAGSMWAYRLEHHILGWLTRGFGFPLDSPYGWLGIAVLVAGWALFFRERLVQNNPPAKAPRSIEPQDDADSNTSFWRANLPWACAYLLMIFCLLPGDTRYYLPIFPLLILPAILGWLSLKRVGKYLALLVPVATLGATLPFIAPNHTELAPPVRLMLWLQEKYPPADRSRVLLILSDDRRHAQWYAPGFPVLTRDDPPPASMPPPGALAVYTDDPPFAARYLPSGSATVWTLAQSFHRSPLIYRKHNQASLYLLDGAAASPSPGNTRK